MPGACIVPVGTESAHNEGMGATLRVQWLTLRSGRRALRVREVICDLRSCSGCRSSHAVLLIQRISSQLSASHAVSNRTNSCIVFCGIVVIGACKAGPHVFVTETTRVVLGFLPARPNAGLCRSSRGLKKQSRPISPTPAKSGKVSMRRSRGKGRNSTTVVSMGPAEPALSKRSHLVHQI